MLRKENFQNHTEQMTLACSMCRLVSTFGKVKWKSQFDLLCFMIDLWIDVNFFFSPTDKWSPALQIRTVLLSIQALLSAPNPDDPLANDVAEQWKENEVKAIETGETQVWSFSLMLCIKHNKECFTRYPNTEKWVEKRHSQVLLNNFLVFRYLIKHSFACLI